MFEDITKEDTKENYIDNNIYYGDINLGTPEEISNVLDIMDLAMDKSIENMTKLKTVEKQLKESFDKGIDYENQIIKLADFLIKNFGEKICGSAIDTAINILSDVRSIEYNNGNKEEYENGIIIGASGQKI